MKTFVLILLLFWVVVPSIAQEDSFSFKWDNGFALTSKSKDFKLKFGGRIMYDAGAVWQDDAIEEQFGEFTRGSGLRRARLFMSGTVYKNLDFKFNVDFAGGGGNARFKDVWLQLKKVPVLGHIRVGHFKEPFRLEVMSSSKYIVFMERSFSNGFSPERNGGILLHNTYENPRISWQLGAFLNTDNYGIQQEGGGYNVTGRITALPIYDEAKRELLHLGFSSSYRQPSENEYQIASRPETPFGNKLLATGTIENVTNINLFGGELSYVKGALGLQGEVALSQVSVSDASSLNFQTYYAQASYFLTGETRIYKNSYEGFDRIIPNKNLGEDGGIGALQLALRYSYADLDDHLVKGGKMGDVTLGMNWYLNPVSRFMFNYVYSDLSGVGNTHIAQARFQVDF